MPESFSWGVLHRRHPALIQKVHDAHPYPPAVHAALDRLLEEVTAGKIEPLRGDAADIADWNRWGREYYGQSWYDIPFMWAESYFYRKLLDATDYFRPGAWQGIDPFDPQKTAELSDPSLATELGGLDALADMPSAQRSAPILHAALWGNRADLGFRMSDPGVAEADHVNELITDDSSLMWQLVDASAPGIVCLVADNAGRELLPDLVLIDYLLLTQRAARVELHVKPYPYYVSDATTTDLISCLRKLISVRGAARDIGRRLWQAIGEGRLEVYTDLFYCAPLSYHDTPTALANRFASAKLTILKGDLNYRRLVGDMNWPATSTFASLTGYFPGPVAALRTLKSDVIVGLDDAALASLDASGTEWRVKGTHALIQMRP